MRSLTWVRDGASDRYADLEINCWTAVAEVTNDASAAAEAVAGMFGTTPEAVLASPLTLLGTPSEIGDRLRERRERWDYSYIVLPGDRARDFAPIVAELTGT